jgi:hypothetical protein
MRSIRPVLSFVAMAALSSVVHAQGVTVSGLMHVPLGQATLDPPVERRLPVRNLGPSGQDGVSIVCSTLSGVGGVLDLSAVMQTPGAVCRVQPRGWDGTIKGTLSLQRAACCGDHDWDGTADFTSLGAIAVRWCVRDRAGNVLAEGQTAGSVCTARGGSIRESSLYFRCRNGFQTGGSPSGFGIELQCVEGDMTVTGLGPAPIHHANALEFFPIICITSPCPGQWNNLSALEITASGLVDGTLEVSNARKLFSVTGQPTPVGEAAQRVAEVWGTGSAMMMETCPNPGGCEPSQVELHVMNLGPSGEDGVVFDLESSLTLHDGGVVHRDLAARNFTLDLHTTPGAGGGSGSGFTMEARGGCCRGHVTLMKLYDDEEPATGARFVRCDPGGRGAVECDVQCFSASGALLASGVVSGADAVMCLPISGPLTFARLGVSNGGMERGGMGDAMCILSGGVAVAGVDRIRFTPRNPTRPDALIASVVCKGKHIATVRSAECSYDPAEFTSGLDHAALGEATLEPAVPGAERRLAVRNLGSSGQDGVEVRFDATGGGVSVDIAPLLGPSPASREIRVRPKGWDGTIKGTLRLTGNPDGTLTETYDFTPVAAPALRWRLYGAGGVVRAQGVSPGPTLSWNLDVPGSGSAAIDKCYWSDGRAAVGRRALQGFFDIAVAVSGLTPTPVTGVHFIEVTPDPCAGLPENCPPGWTNLASMQVTASGLPEFTVADAAIRVPVPPPGSPPIEPPLAVARCDALHHATVIADVDFAAAPSLVVRNIGSSGQDGVRLAFFETGDKPSQGQFSFSVDADNWSPAGPGGGSSITTNARKKCPECPPGHITLMKLYDDEADGARRCGADFEGRGSATCLARCLSVSGAVLASAVMSPAERVSIPLCGETDHLRWTVDSAGDATLELPAACDAVSLPGAPPVAGVRRVVFTPINPSVAPAMFDDCLVTAVSLDEVRVSNLSVSTFCPADRNRDGAITPADVAVFVSDWFASLSQGTLAGDFNGDGVVTPADVATFVSAWAATIAQGRC